MKEIGATIDAARHVIDVLRSRPELARHAEICVSRTGGVDVSIWCDGRTEVATGLRAFGGKWSRNDPATGRYHAENAIWAQESDGVKICLIVDRDAVCTRVEVGRHTVEVEVPTATRMETQEVIDYEWQCHPVLAAS